MMKNINKTFSYLIVALVALVVGLAVLMFGLTSTAYASGKPYFVMGPPTVLVKVGVDPTIDKNNTLIVEFESGVCVGYVHCYNPFIMHLSDSEGEDTGAGLDYVYQVAKTKNKNALKVAIGAVCFDDKESMLHVGATFEFFTSSRMGYSASFDNYIAKDSSPISLISLGIHFK